jgi:protein-histidine pros-kinase
MKLSLRFKFNLVFAAIFGIGLLGSAWLAQSLLYRSAREETLQNARLLMEAAAAARSYTSEQLVPLMQTLMELPMNERFLPQSVPSYAATESLAHLRGRFPEFSYKEATLNPTNPRDRASDWEADVIQKLKDDPGSAEFVGERSTPTGPTLYVARPIRIQDGACLACHSTPGAAPRAMLAQYGPSNGFGWRLHDVVGAQIVSVPAAVPLERAHLVFRTFMLALLGVFAAVFAAFNLMLHALVTRRLTRLTGLANDVSLGRTDQAAFDAQGEDEIAQLAQSFGRMHVSLASAMQMLGE